jgi:hypothetical protein
MRTMMRVISVGVLMCVGWLFAGEKETGTEEATGRVIPCRLVNGLQRSDKELPILAVVTKEVRWNGVVVVPAGTQIEGSTRGHEVDRIIAKNEWRMLFRDGQRVTVGGVALDSKSRTGLEATRRDFTWFLVEPGAGFTIRLTEAFPSENAQNGMLSPDPSISSPLDGSTKGDVYVLPVLRREKVVMRKDPMISHWKYSLMSLGFLTNQVAAETLGRQYVVLKDGTYGTVMGRGNEVVRGEK